MIPLFAVPANDDDAGPVSVTSFDRAEPNKNGVDDAGAGFAGIENIGLLILLPNILVVDAAAVDVAAAVAAAVVVVEGFTVDVTAAAGVVALDALPNWNPVGLFSAGCDPKLNELLAGAPKENF